MRKDILQNSFSFVNTSWIEATAAIQAARVPLVERCLGHVSFKQFDRWKGISMFKVSFHMILVIGFDFSWWCTKKIDHFFFGFLGLKRKILFLPHLGFKRLRQMAFQPQLSSNSFTVWCPTSRYFAAGSKASSFWGGSRMDSFVKQVTTDTSEVLKEFQAMIFATFSLRMFYNGHSLWIRLAMFSSFFGLISCPSEHQTSQILIVTWPRKHQQCLIPGLSEKYISEERLWKH